MATEEVKSRESEVAGVEKEEREDESDEEGEMESVVRFGPATGGF